MRVLVLVLVGCGRMEGTDAGLPVLPVDDAGSADSGIVDAGQQPVDCNAGVLATAEVVPTERGPVRGLVSSEGRAFRGIAYVKPPVGALRWKPPQEDRACWPQVRDATQFGPKCPQLDQQQGMPFDAGAPFDGAEDCLTLNVFTPPAVSADAGLPVMVFIHGGGNTVGSAIEPAGTNDVLLYDGTRLALRGNVIVVTMQYRIGLLGYLSLPALDAETDGGVSGNYGLMDQQAALRWVQRNVRQFGGDPSRVLLFGESAGAVNTCTHLALPGSAGLFHRAIVQSGACSSALTPDVRRAEAARWLGGTGCASSADLAACLRGLSPEVLIRAYPVPVVVGGRRPDVSWGPVVDGRTLPEVPFQAMRAGRHHKVPLIVGSNLDETALTAPPITTEAEYRGYITAQLGPAVVDRVTTELYPSATYGSPRGALIQVTTDVSFGCTARLSSRAAAQGQPGVPIYRYLFERAIVPARGAFHGVELAYLFQRLDQTLPFVPPADRTVQSAMLTYWTNFAATGNPNGAGVLAWPELGRSETLLRLDGTLSTGTGWRTTECDFWDSLSGISIPAPP